MILVDTSVWIDHFRRDSLQLAAALEDGMVLAHPFITGELACGNLRNRREILSLMSHLPPAPRATDHEVLAFVEGRSLYGKGIGYVDAHLLASVALGAETQLWTLDRRLANIAAKLGVLYS